MARTAAAVRSGFGALILLLAGCAAGPDSEQEMLCRRIVPTLFDSDRTIEVLASEAGRAGEVFIRLSVSGSPGAHVVYCRFAGSGFSQRKRDLLAVSADGRPVGESGLHFLRDGWLQSQDSIAAMPPRARSDSAASLAPTAAYALQQAVSALPKTGILMLLSSAYALIYGLTGRINLAFGAFAALGGVSAVIAIAALDLAGSSGALTGLALGLAAGPLLAAGYGLATARLVIAPLAERPGQHLLVASAGLMIALEEFLRLAQGANTRWLAPAFTLPIPLARAPDFEVTATPSGLLTALAATLAALALLAFLSASRFGRRWRAVSDDSVAAALCGVSATATLATTFALACGLAGFSGALVAVHYGGMGFAGGAMLGLTALVAAVFGGIGSVGGAMLGALAISALEAAWAALLPMEYREVAIFLLLALVLALRPDGLLGGRQPGPLRV